MSDVIDPEYLRALGRERAQYASHPAHYGRVLMVDAHLRDLGYAADDLGAVRKLPPVERARPETVKADEKPRRAPRERAVEAAPERAVPKD